MPHALETLVLSFKQLGDMVCLEPALRKLARQGRRPGLLTRESFAPLLELMDGVVRVPDRPWLVRCEDLWCTHWSSKAAVRSALVRAKRKHLLATREENLSWYDRFVYRDCVIRQRIDEYWAKYLWHNVGPAPEAGESFTPPRLKLPPDAWRPKEDLPDGYIVVHPSAAWPEKFWPAESCARFCQQMSEDGHAVVLTTGPAAIETALAAEITRSAPGITNRAGRLGLRGYFWVLSRARLVVAVDGSASHLSSAFGRPTLTLFGTTDHDSWHWPTVNSRRLTTFELVGERTTLDRMSIEAVVAEARALLSR